MKIALVAFGSHVRGVAAKGGLDYSDLRSQAYSLPPMAYARTQQNLTPFSRKDEKAYGYNMRLSQRPLTPDL